MRQPKQNIRNLLPIRRSVIDMGGKVQIVGDRLTIDSKLYTLNNLSDLHPDLSPTNLFTKAINSHLSGHKI